MKRTLSYVRALSGHEADESNEEIQKRQMALLSIFLLLTYELLNKIPFTKNVSKIMKRS